MHPGFNPETDSKKERLTLRTIIPRTLRAVGRLAQKLSNSSEQLSENRQFNVTAEPLHYRTEEAEAEIKAGLGPDSEGTWGIVRQSDRPENPDQN